MNKITKQVLEKYLDENGKIYLPDFCERVLFDIGTSYNAPHSQVWTKETKDVCVFAFEPNPFNIECLNEGRWLKSSWQHPLQLNPEVSDEKVFLINAALLDGNPKYVDFYCAEEDPGTSSVYDQMLGKNLKRPFLHVRYRASQTDNRKMKTWVTGSVGAATSALDAMQIHMLSERCLITQGANNFMLMQ